MNLTKISDAYLCDWLSDLDESRTNEQKFRKILKIRPNQKREFYDLLVKNVSEENQGTETVYYYDGCKYCNDKFKVDLQKPYSLQVGAFQHLSYACEFLKKLKNKGFPAYGYFRKHFEKNGLSSQSWNVRK